MLAISRSTNARSIVSARPARPARSFRQVRVPVRVHASSNFESDIDAEALKAKLQDGFTSTTTKIKAKWAETEDKPVVVSLGAAAIFGLVALNAIADAIDRIPLVGPFMELVGICATSWFTYRYLVFGPDREELKQIILDFGKKVQGK